MSEKYEIGTTVPIDPKLIRALEGLQAEERACEQAMALMAMRAAEIHKQIFETVREFYPLLKDVEFALDTSRAEAFVMRLRHA